MSTRIVVLLGLLVGCSKFVDNRPIQGGGDDDIVTGGGHPDAAVADGNDANNTISGRVCLLTDSRDVGKCQPSGAGNLTVTLGTSPAALTADNGDFTIATPTGSNLVWHVTGASLQTTVMPFNTILAIPALTQNGYIALAAANGHPVVAGQGAIFAQVVRAGAPLAQATAVSSDLNVVDPLYDNPGTTADSWTQTAVSGTGPLGMTWWPGMDVGTPTITVTPHLAASVAPVSVPVEADAITYVQIAIP
jgi:hypothetical protein